MTIKHDSLESVDFRKPRRLAAAPRRTLESWMSDGCTLTVERWRRLNLDVKLSLDRTLTLSLDSALESFADPGWGMQAGVGVSSFMTLITSRPRWLRSMVKLLLGEESSAEQTDAPLTAIEESMVELLFQEFMTGFSDAWPGAEPLPIRLRESVRRPRRTRLYPPHTTLTIASFQIESSVGSDHLLWALPQQDIEDLVEIECAPPDLPRVVPSPDIPRLVRAMTVPMTVELGNVTLSMAELTSLQTGDVIVLDQSSTHPLFARIGGAMKFQGRPGRIGTQRCLEIEQILDNDAPLSVLAPKL